MFQELTGMYEGIGPLVNYVLGIIPGFNESNSNKGLLKVRTRGQAITSTIDPVKITRHRFMKELSIGKIMRGIDEMTPTEESRRAMKGSTVKVN